LLYINYLKVISKTDIKPSLTFTTKIFYKYLTLPPLNHGTFLYSNIINYFKPVTYKSINIAKPNTKDKSFFTKIVTLILLVSVAAGVNWMVFNNQKSCNVESSIKNYFENIQKTNIQKYTNSLTENIALKK